MNERHESRFEFCTEASSKFWEPQLEGNTLTVRFGKIGTIGQPHTKQFPSPAKAEAECRKLVCEKLAKGYKPTAQTVLALLEHAAPTEEPKAVCKAMMAHHTDSDIADSLCGWLTACLQYGMPSNQFGHSWNRFCDEEDGELIEAFGEEWLDSQEDDLAAFYKKAIEGGADRVLWHDQNAYVNLIACTGDPGARAIEVCAVSAENCTHSDGTWFTAWPNELGLRTPIASIDQRGATLRGGRLIEVPN